MEKFLNGDYCVCVNSIAESKFLIDTFLSKDKKNELAAFVDYNSYKDTKYYYIEDDSILQVQKNSVKASQACKRGVIVQFNELNRRE